MERGRLDIPLSMREKSFSHRREREGKLLESLREQTYTLVRGRWGRGWNVGESLMLLEEYDIY